MWVCVDGHELDKIDRERERGIGEVGCRPTAREGRVRQWTYINTYSLISLTCHYSVVVVDYFVGDDYYWLVAVPMVDLRVIERESD